MTISINVNQSVLYKGDTLYVRGYRSGDSANVDSVKLRLSASLQTDNLNRVINVGEILGGTYNSIDNSYSVGFNEQSNSFVIGLKITDQDFDASSLSLSVRPDGRLAPNQIPDVTFASAVFSLEDSERPGGPLGDKSMPGWFPPLASDDLMYRFSTEGQHYWASGPEADYITDNLTNYQNEGPAWNDLTAGEGSQTWRFRNKVNGANLWTSSQEEYNNLTFNSEFNEYWNFEGASFTVYSLDDPQPSGTIAVQRLYSPVTDFYMWSADQNEINSLIALQDWTLEGPAFFVPA